MNYIYGFQHSFMLNEIEHPGILQEPFRETITTLPVKILKHFHFKWQITMALKEMTLLLESLQCGIILFSPQGIPGPPPLQSRNSNVNVWQGCWASRILLEH